MQQNILSLDAALALFRSVNLKILPEVVFSRTALFRTTLCMFCHIQCSISNSCRDIYGRPMK